jgi:hypothetical protein
MHSAGFSSEPRYGFDQLVYFTLDAVKLDVEPLGGSNRLCGLDRRP